jgi:hypothetical protein
LRPDISAAHRLTARAARAARAALASLLITLFFADPAAAFEMRNRDQIIELVRAASQAKTPTDLDRILRRVAEGVPDNDTSPATTSYGVVWYDNWNPRARIWIKGVDADHLFREVLLDAYLMEAVDIVGSVDLELEIRAGVPATLQGRLRMHDATLRWKEGDFALLGVNGYLPFSRTIGPPGGAGVTAAPTGPLAEGANISIDTLHWVRRPVASNLVAIASYRDRIMRFDRIRMSLMGGRGVGSIVMDHRGEHWRTASMIRLMNVDMNRLHEILPGIPLFARVTLATVSGEIGLIYSAPDRVNVTGQIESMTPGVIELSPLMREAARDLIDSRVIRFQKLVIHLGRNDRGQVEAQIDLYRRTAQSLMEIARGVPFNPVLLTIHVPLLPFLQQLHYR